MALLRLFLKPGVDKQNTEYGAEGGWVDCDYVRFRYGLPEKMGLKLVEPLRELFKDEVRQVGLDLGLPPEIVWRHPFPGPGLAIRIIGAVDEERLAILREADAIALKLRHTDGKKHQRRMPSGEVARAVFDAVEQVGEAPRGFGCSHFRHEDQII